MVKTLVKRLANQAGLDIHKLSRAGWRWSYHVDDYYPVRPVPRWGYDKPPHPQLNNVLGQGRHDYIDTIGTFAKFSSIMKSVPKDGSPDSMTPYWTNGWFENLDAAALIGILASRAPKTYMEIGSGNSTKFARHTIRQAGLPSSIISIDPMPRAGIDTLCDRIVRAPLEDCDIAVFDQLEAGDVLFFDGSHRAFTNSDVTVFFLDVLPRLKPGIVIHIHDIFLPWDYLPEWEHRMYSEQYMLAAMLLCPQPGLKVISPNFFSLYGQRSEASRSRIA